MTDSEATVNARPGLVSSIHWVAAAYGGAALGGVMWAVVARLAFQSDGELRTAGPFWPIVAVGCLVVFVIGLAATFWAHRSALKTVGVAVAVAPLTGAVLAGFIRILYLTDPATS